MDTALLSRLSDWAEAIERKQQTDVVYFDFSKPSNKVRTLSGELIFKVEAVGIRPTDYGLDQAVFSHGEHFKSELGPITSNSI